MTKKAGRIQKCFRFLPTTAEEIDDLAGWQVGTATGAVTRAIHEAWERESAHQARRRARGLQTTAIVTGET